MCGIAGAFFFSAGNGPAIERLRHRGRDGFARYEHPRCQLSLARLAMVRPDLPAHVARTGRLVAVSNGEIYNFRELGSADVDTDLVPALFQKHGAAFVRRVRGPLTCAIFDEANERLVLVRDAVGKRPLYYVVREEAVYFASEMKALTPYASRVNPDYVTSVLAMGVAEAELLPYLDMFALSPGHALFVSPQGARLERVDTLEPTAPAHSDDVAHAFEQAVKMRIPTDVSAAVAVAGMDSLLIADHCALPAWIIDRDAEETATAARLRKDLQRTPMMTPDLESLRDALWLTESADAYAAWHMAPAVYAFGKTVGVKALLTGEGADELFLGYPWQLSHTEPWTQRSIVQGEVIAIPDEWFAAIDKAREKVKALAQAHRAIFAHTNIIAALVGTAIAPPAFARVEEASRTRRIQLESLRHDMHTLPILHNDRMFLAAGVETRMPFLDRAVVDAALGLDASDLLGEREKPVVRALFKQRYGEDAPTKHGFAADNAPPLERLRPWLERQTRVVDGATLKALLAGKKRWQTTLAWRAFLIEELYALLPIDRTLS